MSKLVVDAEWMADLLCERSDERGWWKKFKTTDIRPLTPAEENAERMLKLLITIKESTVLECSNVTLIPRAYYKITELLADL